MVNLTKTAAFEWCHAQVRVNAVAPGWVASSGMDSYGPAMAPMIHALKDNLPMGRLGLGGGNQLGHLLSSQPRCGLRGRASPWPSTAALA